MAKSRAQNHEHKNTSEILRAQNSKFYILAISSKLYAGKFLETICWEILGNYMLGNSWKLHAGKFLETICWKIRVDAGYFLKGVIMAQCFGIILRFQGNGTWSSVEHPSSADLSRTKCSEASKVIGRVSKGIGMQNPAGSKACPWWVSMTTSKQRVRLWPYNM